LTYPGQPADYTSAEKDLPETQAGVGIAKSKTTFAELGNQHMETLKSLAIKAGIDVSIYTATGWGYAAIIPDGCIPVTAEYAYPTWTKKKELSPFFLYKYMHKNPDYAPVRYNPEDYPVFPAELGTGIASDYTRRPTVVQKSFDAMINRCIGSGANGLGYYMYH
jgi:beta-galactosidase